MRADLTMTRIADVDRVVIESRQGTDDTDHHRHGVGIVMETLEKAQQRIVDHRVVSDDLGEVFELNRRRQFAVQQQIGHFDKSRLFRQLLNRVTAIAQNAFVTVEGGNGAVAARRRYKAWIVGKHLGLAVQTGDIDGVRTFGAGKNIQID